MSRLSKILFFGVTFFILGMLILRTLLFQWFSRPLPVTKGKIQLHALTDSVRVYRDGFSIPHILADADRDVWFMQGYVTAQDRFFQMDFWRSLADGRLSGLLGPEAGSTDSLMVNLGLDALAGRLVQGMRPEIRACYDAYTEGVNAWLDRHRKRMPIEYSILHVRPGPWKTEDCLLVYLAYAAFMDWGDGRAFLIPALSGRIVGPQMSRLLPGSPHARAGAKYSRVFQGFVCLLDSVRRQGFLPGDLSGGHCFAVPARSALSARPILATALSAQPLLPGIYYEIHLKGPHIHAAGISLPGYPFILYGNNARTAWGGQKRIWRPDFMITGSISKPEDSGSALLCTDRISKLSLYYKWPESAEPGSVFFRVMTSSDAESAVKVLQTLTLPAMEWICVDSVRDLSSLHDPALPAAGKDAAAGAASSRPMLLRMIGDTLAGRMENVRMTVMECQDIQTDNYSFMAGAILPGLLKWLPDSAKEAASGTHPESGRSLSEWKQKLYSWDRVMRSGDAETVVYAAWIRHIVRTLFSDLDPDLLDALMASPVLWQEMLFKCFEKDGFIHPMHSRSVKSVTKLIRLCLKDALQEIAGEQGEDPGKWSWGSVHAMTYHHILYSHPSFEMSRSFGFTQPFQLGPYAMDGGPATMLGNFTPERSCFAYAHAARLIVDMNQLDNSVSILAAGQSGQIVDAHYMDQIPLYTKKYYHPNLFSVDRIRDAGWDRVDAGP
ncbi:penicillin acylase family protein [bacterium]|nr:penicillin acylase family protein [bacterium]